MRNDAILVDGLFSDFNAGVSKNFFECIVGHACLFSNKIVKCTLVPLVIVLYWTASLHLLGAIEKIFLAVIVEND